MLNNEGQTQCPNLGNIDDAGMVEDTVNRAATGQRISVQRCRQVLGDTNTKLTDQEVLTVRDFLYQLADIVCGDIERANYGEEETCAAE